ncbi:hypothetical protein ACFL6E_00180 [Candidatus Neomarinimicrobiota bacterium]
MNSIISKYDINHFLIWAGSQAAGNGLQSVSNLISELSLARDHIPRSNIVQLGDGETVRLTQHTAFQLSRRSITLDEVKHTIENPDAVYPDSLDPLRKIYQKYYKRDTRINIMLASSASAERLVVGAWVGPV